MRHTRWWFSIPISCIAGPRSRLRQVPCRAHWSTSWAPANGHFRGVAKSSLKNPKRPRKPPCLLGFFDLKRGWVWYTCASDSGRAPGPEHAPSNHKKITGIEPDGRTRQRDHSRQHRRRDAPELPRLRNERDRGTRAAGRARWTETRASPRVVRDERTGQRLEQAVQEIRTRR